MAGKARLTSLTENLLQDGKIAYLSYTKVKKTILEYMCSYVMIAGQVFIENAPEA